MIETIFILVAIALIAPVFMTVLHYWGIYADGFEDAQWSYRNRHRGIARKAYTEGFKRGVRLLKRGE